jgi:hypothetical protein
MPTKTQPSNSASRCTSLTLPELEQSKTTVLLTLASAHSVVPTNTPSKSSLPGFAPSLGEALIGQLSSDTARFLNVSPRRPQ